MTDTTARGEILDKIRRNHTPAGLDSTLGMCLVSATHDEVVIKLPITEAVRQPHGIVHGGTYCALVESAASIGGSLWASPGSRVVGVSNHTSFLSSAREGELVATATPLHRGRTMQVWGVQIVDGRGTRMAVGRMHLANLVSD